MNNHQIKPEATPDDRATAVKRIADSLDLAVLKPTATAAEVRAACEMVNRYGIKSVCVPTSFVSFATLYTDRVCAVVGFPHGNTTPFTKTVEAVEAMGSGAKEIDVVVNYGRLLDGDPGPIRTELTQIVAEARPRRAIVKAILETCYYTPSQIRDASRLCADSGVDYIKTSTGVAPHGATPDVVQIMLDAVRGDYWCGVKASGGINTYADAVRYLEMGCTRIGSSKFQELLP